QDEVRALQVGGLELGRPGREGVAPTLPLRLAGGVRAFAHVVVRRARRGDPHVVQPGLRQPRHQDRLRGGRAADVAQADRHDVHGRQSSRCPRREISRIRRPLPVVGWGMTQDVLLLLGKPPRPGTVVLEVVEGLRAAGAVVHVHLPHEERTRSRPAEVALVVHRGLSRSAQAEVATWQARGVRVCNPWGGTVLARDRSGTAEALAAAGVRTPVTTRATSWSDVLDLADRRRSTGGVVVKGPGSRGRGAAVLVDPLPDGAPGDGPWTVEERVPSDGTDHKLYVAGSWVGGLRKPSP